MVTILLKKNESILIQHEDNDTIYMVMATAFKTLSMGERGKPFHAFTNAVSDKYVADLEKLVAVPAKLTEFFKREYQAEVNPETSNWTLLRLLQPNEYNAEELVFLLETEFDIHLGIPAYDRKGGTEPVTINTITYAQLVEAIQTILRVRYNIELPKENNT